MLKPGKYSDVTHVKMEPLSTTETPQKKGFLFYLKPPGILCVLADVFLRGYGRTEMFSPPAEPWRFRHLSLELDLSYNLDHTQTMRTNNDLVNQLLPIYFTHTCLRWKWRNPHFKLDFSVNY